MKHHIKSYSFIILSLIAVLFLSHGAVVYANDKPKKMGKTADFDKMLTYVSSAPFYSVDGSFLVDGMIAGDGLHFQREVLGRSDEEIAEYEQQAKDFFLQRFGVDTQSGDVYFTGFEVMPEIEYHVVFETGARTPKKGWPVHDGGWITVVTNPEGITLGGEFSGVHVPPNTMFVKGNYKIVKTKKTGDGEIVKSIIIDYQSSKPILMESDGSFAVSCELFNAKWGEGQAIGATLPIVLSDGRMVYNTRNVLTFPPFGKTAEPLR